MWQCIERIQLIFCGRPHFRSAQFWNRLIFQCAPFYLWHVSIPTFNLFEVQLIFTSNAIIHDDAQKWHIFFINLFGRSMEFAYFRRNELGKRAQATNSLDHQQNQKHFQFYMVVAIGWRKSRNRFRPQCLISKWFLFSVYEPLFLILVSNSRSINDYHCKSSRFEAKHNNYNAPFKLCPIWIHSLTHTHTNRQFEILLQLIWRQFVNILLWRDVGNCEGKATHEP